VGNNEIIYFRHLNMMDETYVVNQAKEDACFVSQNFLEDMRLAKIRGPGNNILREYVLPDYTNISRGYSRNPSETDKYPDLVIVYAVCYTEE